jgi:hypothetical protein
LAGFGLNTSRISVPPGLSACFAEVKNAFTESRSCKCCIAFVAEKIRAKNLSALICRQSRSNQVTAKRSTSALRRALFNMGEEMSNPVISMPALAMGSVIRPVPRPLPIQVHWQTLTVSERMGFRVRDLQTPGHRTRRPRKYPCSRVVSLRVPVFHRREYRCQAGEDAAAPIRAECAGRNCEQAMYPQ